MAITSWEAVVKVTEGSTKVKEQKPSCENQGRVHWSSCEQCDGKILS